MTAGTGTSGSRFHLHDLHAATTVLRDTGLDRALTQLALDHLFELGLVAVGGFLLQKVTLTLVLQAPPRVVPVDIYGDFGCGHYILPSGSSSCIANSPRRRCAK